MSHSRIAPSSAERWVACTGSVLACAELPDDESDAAKEGTAAHEIAEKMLRSYLAGYSYPVRAEYVGKVDGNGVLCNDEMFEGCLLYLEAIKSIPNTSFHENYGIESRVYAPKIHDESFGTVDFWHFENDTLHIVDFKYGYVPVSPVHNWQLINYAAGDKFIKLKPKSVKFYIIQPRAYGFDDVRTWRTDYDNLSPYFDMLSVAAHSALSGRGKMETGSHCRNCLNLLNCEAAQLSTLAAIDFIGHRSNVITTDNNQLNAELKELTRAKNIVDMMLEAKETDALTRLEKGECLVDFEIGAGRSKNVWSIPDNQVLSMSKLCGVNASKPEKPLTPKQAIKAGLNPDVVKSISENKPGAIKLKRVDIKKIMETISNV